MQQGRSNDFGQVFKLALMLGVLEARFELLQPGVYLLQSLDLGHQLHFFGGGDTTGAKPASPVNDDAA